MLNATYTKDSVAALRKVMKSNQRRKVPFQKKQKVDLTLKVRERLCLRLEEREQELFNLRSSLKQYQAKLKYQIPENNIWGVGGRGIGSKDKL